MMVTQPWTRPREQSTERVLVLVLGGSYSLEMGKYTKTIQHGKCCAQLHTVPWEQRETLEGFPEGVRLK